MFLVTTADQRFWDTSSRILFLGEWCRLYSQRQHWGHLDSDMLPYHWDDRERLYRDYLYLRGVYERQLHALSDGLNALHGVNHSQRYWRIVAGRWLYYFIEAFFDRYLSICSARDSGRVTGTWLPTVTPAATWTPGDFTDFTEWLGSDAYNLQLYAGIIRRTRALPYTSVDSTGSRPPVAVQLEARSGWRRLAKRALWSYSVRMPARRNAVVFVEPHLQRSDLTRLQRALGQWPSLLPRLSNPVDEPVNVRMRERLRVRGEGDPFEMLLADTVPEEIPRAYVEAYERIRDTALRQFPSRPRVIFTANSYSGYEEFKVWTAHQVEQGTRLAIAQHGGHYGSGLWSSTEDHELEIADRYYSWGWVRAGRPKIRPICGGRIAALRDRIRPDPAGEILWVALSLQRYAYFMYSAPVGPQLVDYLGQQRRFFESLAAPARERLMLRLAPRDLGWNEVERWQNLAPSLRFSQGGCTIEEQLSRSRLVIATYNSTTFLETFAADYPTVMFWNPRHWELRPDAQPLYDRLREAAILHDTPESAAGHVSAIADNPGVWWSGANVRSALEQFRWQFVRLQPTWLEDLAGDLAGLTKDASAPRDRRGRVHSSTEGTVAS